MKKTSALVLSALTLTLIFSMPLAAHANGPAIVNLLSAKNYAILAKSGISTTGSSMITGDIGVSPITSTSITGFGLNLPTQSPYATSPLVTGKVYAPDYASPTPATLTTAVNDMQTAYTDGAGRSNPTATELGAGNIGGLTIAPGLYKWSTGVIIPSTVTLNGSANDVWIFQIAQTLNVSSSVQVLLSGGAKADNVFWIVGGQATIGTSATFNGTILGQTAIVLNTGAKLNGSMLAQTAVTLDASTVTQATSSNTTTVTPPPSNNSASSPSNTSSNGSSNSSSVPSIINTPQTGSVIDYGCLAGYKFSITTGHLCTSYVGSPVQQPVASSWGQQVRLITLSLMQGYDSSDVATLQSYLIWQNKGSAAQALAHVGATGYFGMLTRAALAEFQAHVGINPALGNFGPITRTYLALHQD